MSKLPINIVVTGHKNHGKDTFCKRLVSQFISIEGTPLLRWQCSSTFCGVKAVFPALKDRYGYRTFQECFNDRVNHRNEWYDLITAYNTPDLTRLGSELFAEYDIYAGLRSINELTALRNSGILDIVIFIDASKRLPLEDESSMTIKSSDADIIVDNNGTEEEFFNRIERVSAFISKLLFSGTKS